ncbi:hypothetical protein HPB49_008558 [Dermacentor silvarum]|uniref:Uncharacterized protein n=1 Tax=Dermacentor silvarum TaxID=543639 RepID=A0ACB8D445_DERSI|nr:hypothetical protein HPB49_008558 [Dermacentor silvarum]
MDIGCLNEVNEILTSSGIPLDHSAMVSAKSDSRVIYYVTGYVARRMIRKTKCDECAKALIRPPDSEMPPDACIVTEVDRGGLIYPSYELHTIITKMEDSFTYCFSFSKLKANSIMDLISALARNRLNHVGWKLHSTDVTNSLIKFYTMTRLHFIVKAENKAREVSKMADCYGSLTDFADFATRVRDIMGDEAYRYALPLRPRLRDRPNPMEV